ncbi:MAG: hypothetical protein UX75_C0059G0007 [Candidatus Moranbacteria bacterium GW2011_GWE2_47_10]|nr:MAG: hypothetical protein UX75_C0059G0007 [Candidatus Moranbacteria bacterium GW2011_GWE2_47_10]
MKVYKVTPGKDLNPCTEKDPAAALVWLEESEPGDVITIEVKEMSLADYEALPEYMGP